MLRETRAQQLATAISPPKHALCCFLQQRTACGILQQQVRVWLHYTARSVALNLATGRRANACWVVIWEPIPIKSSILQWAVPVPYTECAKHESSSGGEN
eukprot:357337-Chlamydomonas_euryale.AAC.3